MRSAAVLMLATLLGLAMMLMSGRAPESAEKQPQTSPPAQAEPPAEKPTLTDDYEAAMAERDRKVILVFGAEWCPHCVLLKEHLKKMNLEGYLVCTVDVDESKDIKRRYSVKSLPTSVLLEGGKEVSREKGFRKESYEAWVEKNR